MEHVELHDSLVVLLIGLIIGVSVFINGRIKRIGIPSLVGFILLGLVVGLVDTQVQLLTVPFLEVLRILADFGIIVLLFRIGLESDLQGLADKLGKACPIWILSIMGSGGAGFAAAYWLLDAGPGAAIFVGVAMTATSVGVSTGVWKEQQALDSGAGKLLLDVVELDDLSGVILMTLLFGLVSGLAGGGGTADPWQIAGQFGLVLLKLGGFLLFCFLFMRYVERPFTRYVESVERGPEPMITMLALSFVTASVAGVLGFSLAIGAFFAGIIFSQDEEAVKMETAFMSLHDFFMPFFFIWIGISLPIESLGGALIPGAILFAAAAGGKLLFSCAPALAVINTGSAALIGLSMVPRAEITMIIMQEGRASEVLNISDELFGGMVLVVLLTSTAAPILLRMWLARVQVRSS
jgi:Kef-type K+ transport system membrane component KefB